MRNTVLVLLLLALAPVSQGRQGSFLRSNDIRFKNGLSFKKILDIVKRQHLEEQEEDTNRLLLADDDDDDDEVYVPPHILELEDPDPPDKDENKPPPPKPQPKPEPPKPQPKPAPKPAPQTKPAPRPQPARKPVGVVVSSEATPSAAGTKVALGLSAYLVGALLVLFGKTLCGGLRKMCKKGDADFEAVQSDDKPTFSDETIALRSRVQQTSGLFLFTAIYFWVWALRNVIAGQVKFDLGLVTFFLAALTHALALISTRLHDKLLLDSPKDTVISRANLYSNLVLWVHLVVALNYIAGIVYYTSVVLKAYCAVFFVVWIVSGVFLRLLSKKWRLAVAEEEVEEEPEEKKSYFQKFKSMLF